MKLSSCFATAAAVLSVAASAHADLPVIVEYVAPPECASLEAFHALIATQLTANPARPWRFTVTVRREDEYVASITSAAGAREIRATTCDEVVAGAALVIGIVAFDEAPPLETPPLPEPIIAPPVPSFQAPRRVIPDRVIERSEPGASLRLGARFEDWSNLSWLHATGGAATLSYEPTWGAYRMMFEVALGGLSSDFLTPTGAGPMRTAMTWGVLDFQTCPLDLALGRTGLSLLACTRVAGAINHDSWGTTSAALFFGAGGRLRWQTPSPLFFEAHMNGLYGTQSAPFYGSPAWLDIGASAGVRL